MNVPLDSVPYFDAITNSQTTGAVTDADSTPTFAVYENGTDTDIGVGGNMTKRTSLTGNYRCNFTCSAANGFELGKWYNVIASATVGGVSGKARIGNFRIVAAEAVAGYVVSDLTKIAGQTVTAGAGVTFPSSIASPTNITAASGVALSSAGIQAIWDAATSALTTVGSIGKFLLDRLDAAISSRMATFTYTTPPTAVAIRTEMDSNSTKLANLDTNVGSRLATAGYTVPPTAAANASAVRTELTTELGRVDAAISSRLATSGYTVPPTATDIANEVEAQIIDDTDSEKVLTAITDKIASVNPSLGGLTLSAIASAIRTELAVELARIDAAITTRLAGGSYTAPPNASANASAVRTELTTELGRIDVAVSTRTQPTDEQVVEAVVTDALLEIAQAVTANAIRAALGLASANLDDQLATLEGGALDFDAIAESVLLRKITFDSGAGEYVVWNFDGSAELGRLTPTTDAGALPIIGMQPV